MIDLYKQKQRLKISLNDQLEDFYENCKNSNIIEECVYYYHTKRLDSEELQLSKTRFEKFRSRSMRNIRFKRTKMDAIVAKNSERQ